jgi:hypothetical protein
MYKYWMHQFTKPSTILAKYQTPLYYCTPTKISNCCHSIVVVTLLLHQPKKGTLFRPLQVSQLRDVVTDHSPSQQKEQAEPLFTLPYPTTQQRQHNSDSTTATAQQRQHNSDSTTAKRNTNTTLNSQRLHTYCTSNLSTVQHKPHCYAHTNATVSLIAYL